MGESGNDTIHVDPDELVSGLSAILAEYLAAPEATRDVAASLVDADLKGHGSHGTIRLPTYVEMVRDGRIDPDATPAIEREEGPTANVDGRRAFGQLTGRVAVDVLVSKTMEHGVGVVGVRDANHLGRIGEWTERATADGILFAALVKGNGQLVAPPGSSDRTLSTNPISIGVPTFDALPYPIVLDMATSQVAHGKIRERSARGEPLPRSWTTTESGSPVLDATAFVEGAGALLPLGGTDAGYKGFGLSVICELFASILGRSPVPAVRRGGMNNTAAFIGIDPLRFGSRADVEESVETLAGYFRDANSPAAVSPGDAALGVDPLLPGEAEHRLASRRNEEGIPLPREVAASLADLARKHGLLASMPAAFK